MKDNFYVSVTIWVMWWIITGLLIVNYLHYKETQSNTSKIDVIYNIMTDPNQTTIWRR